MTKEFDVQLASGGTLHAYDTVDELGAGFPVFWFHGTPNIGAPPKPLFNAAERLGIRWVSYDRPGYGGSTRRVGRNAASAAADVSAVADALGVERFAVVSHSGGGPHALACAALLPERVVGGAVVIAGLAPHDGEGIDWFAGMNASGVATLRAAAQGPEALKRYEESGAEYDPEFTPADLAAFAGDWGWFDSVVQPAIASGPEAQWDDDLTYVNPWGFDPAQVEIPVLLLHGDRDRMVPSSHSRWLGRHIPRAETRFSPDDGHISILESGVGALEWLAGQISTREGTSHD